MYYFATIPDRALGQFYFPQRQISVAAMHLLLSNDDGIRSEGLKALADALSPLGKITVVAPSRDHSASSNSLTLDAPIRAHCIAENWYSVDGTPTDCVHLAITGLIKDEPDIVIAGINLGANLGDDVIYSGTVAAAMEGRFLGLPAVAISVNSHRPHDLQACARVSHEIISKLTGQQLPQDLIINVNIPDLSMQQIKGMETTRLGSRHKAEPVIESADPRGDTIYWVGAAGPEQDAGPGTDFHAIRNGCVSVTPLHLDLTHYKAMQPIEQWVSACKFT